ncbi:MAG: hypothetical protein NZ700_04145 [Gemmataceae bacterium]|nr:hypothetical protein [Gemmataceae bacterium]MDW8266988.1 hypothetical protein [Gemmataceae bacterium]
MVGRWCVALGSLMVVGLAWGDTPSTRTKIPGQGDAPEVSRPNFDDRLLPTWKIQGRWMTSRTDAVDDALEQAQQVVREYLQSRRPPIEWVPPIEYIQTHMLAENPWHEEARQFPDGMMYRVSLHVRVTPAILRDCAQIDQKRRAEQRMLELGKVVLGLMAVFGAVALYSRWRGQAKPTLFGPTRGPGS